MLMTVPPDVEIQRQLTSVHVSLWLRNDVFTPRWWLLLVLLALAFVIWWKLIDKKRLPEILLYAALSMIVTMAKVEYGEELTLWDYPTDIIPAFPPLTSLNLLSLPLIYSLVYQFFTETKRFIWATLIATALICFVMEPLMAWGRLYELLNWEYYFNYPLYAVVAIAVRAAVRKICVITEHPVRSKK